MDQEQSLGCFQDPVDAQYVIKVSMRRNNARCFGVDIFDEPHNSLWLVTWIDDHRLCSGLKDVTVRLQAAYHNSMDLHSQDHGLFWELWPISVNHCLPPSPIKHSFERSGDRVHMRTSGLEHARNRFATSQGECLP